MVSSGGAGADPNPTALPLGVNILARGTLSGETPGGQSPTGASTDSFFPNIEVQIMITVKVNDAPLWQRSAPVEKTLQGLVSCPPSRYSRVVLFICRDPDLYGPLAH